MHTDKGLRAIAHSSRKTPARATKPLAKPEADKPRLEFARAHQHTSLTLDVGLWDCVLETAHILTKRSRAARRGRVSIVAVLEAAFVAFHRLSLDEQLDLVREQEAQS